MSAKRKSRARLQPGDPGFRAPRMTFQDWLDHHKVTEEQLSGWLPRLTSEPHRIVVDHRRRGASLKSAGEAVGVTREKASQMENRVLRSIRAAADGKAAPLFTQESTMNKPRFVIGIEGGVIQGISGDTDADFIILDYDTEGADPDEIQAEPTGNECFVREESPATDEEARVWVEGVFAMTQADEDDHE